MAAILVFKPAKSPKVGDKLRRLREKAGFSTSEMALYLGYTRKQIENWEAGTSPAKRAILIGYATAAGSSPDKVIEEVARVSSGKHHATFARPPTLLPAA